MQTVVVTLVLPAVVDLCTAEFIVNRNLRKSNYRQGKSDDERANVLICGSIYLT